MQPSWHYDSALPSDFVSYCSPANWSKLLLWYEGSVNFAGLVFWTITTHLIRPIFWSCNSVICDSFASCSSTFTCTTIILCLCNFVHFSEFVS